jgi:hypothetical protein
MNPLQKYFYRRMLGVGLMLFGTAVFPQTEVLFVGPPDRANCVMSFASNPECQKENYLVHQRAEVVEQTVNISAVGHGASAPTNNTQNLPISSNKLHFMDLIAVAQLGICIWVLVRIRELKPINPGVADSVKTTVGQNSNVDRNFQRELTDWMQELLRRSDQSQLPPIATTVSQDEVPANGSTLEQLAAGPIGVERSSPSINQSGLTQDSSLTRSVTIDTALPSTAAEVLDIKEILQRIQKTASKALAELECPDSESLTIAVQTQLPQAKNYRLFAHSSTLNLAPEFKRPDFFSVIRPESSKGWLLPCRENSWKSTNGGYFDGYGSKWPEYTEAAECQINERGQAVLVKKGKLG